MARGQSPEGTGSVKGSLSLGIGTVWMYDKNMPFWQTAKCVLFFVGSCHCGRQQEDQVDQGSFDAQRRQGFMFCPLGRCEYWR